MFRSGVISIFSRAPKVPFSMIFAGFRGFSTLHQSQIAEQSVYSESACKTASNGMSLSFIWWLSFFSPCTCHDPQSVWYFSEKNESHQIKLTNMSFDAVLHADSEYILCLAIWLRWRVEKTRMPVKITRDDAFGVLRKMLITPERNIVSTSAWSCFVEEVMGNRIQ
jgi:hypothetical protein